MTTVTDPIINATASVMRGAPGKRWPCCELVAEVETRVLTIPHGRGSAWWQQANIWDPKQPWSSISCLIPFVRAILGPRANGVPAPNAWHAVQGWSLLTTLGFAPTGNHGHNFLWLSLGDGAHGVCLESDVKNGIMVNGRKVSDPADLLAAFESAKANPIAWKTRIERYRHGVATALLCEVT